MDTLRMLMGRHENQPIIPVEVVARNYFNHEPRVFLRKLDDGSIELPIVRMDKSQKALRGVDIRDLAEYIDARRSDARREFEHLHH